jgi:DNA adenine methylase
MSSTTTSSKVTPPLKWHGGKHYLARRIVSLMPRHLSYVEPFAGGLAVLLAKDPEGVSEVANDRHKDLTNFWDVMKQPDLFAELLRAVQATPLSEVEWQRAVEGLRTFTSAVDRAWAFFVACRQSLAGRMDTFAPLSRTRTRGGMNEQASAWITAIEGLPAVHARLQRVVVLCRDALDVISGQDGPQVLFYCDPPYLSQTRTAKDAYGPFEMTEARHRRLLDVLRQIKGMAMLSGYASDLYDTALAGWNRHTFNVANHAAGGKGKRRMTEVVWCNF